MLNTVQHVLDQPQQIPVTQVSTKSQTLLFIVQVTVICVLLAAGLFAFAWSQRFGCRSVTEWSLRDSVCSGCCGDLSCFAKGQCDEQFIISWKSAGGVWHLPGAAVGGCLCESSQSQLRRLHHQTDVRGPSSNRWL